MATDLAWPNVMRPRVPLVYLDLFAVVRMARALRGDKDVPAGYGDLYDAALRAKDEKRAIFPLGSEHMWEMAKIADPKQRGRLADVLEALSDYQYLMGRSTLAELEFEAGIARILGEDNSPNNYPVIRPTHGHAF